MNAVVDQALILWGLDGASYQLAAARENHVYRVDHTHKRFALRLHRKGYRTDAELRSELLWMHACAMGGITVPRPVPALSGTQIETVADTQVDVLTWLHGAPVDDTLAGQNSATRLAHFQLLGSEMARLHKVSDAWTPPPEFSRPAWDVAGLLGDAPLWDRFWNNPELTKTEHTLLLQFRAHATKVLQNSTLDYGLIHADLVPANVMQDGRTLGLIDFDDGGYGFRLFEVTTALLRYSSDADFDTLRDGLLDGYRSIRPLDSSHFDLFMALRACTYVGWNITRQAEDEARNTRFIAKATQLVRRVLSL